MTNSQGSDSSPGTPEEQSAQPRPGPATTSDLPRGLAVLTADPPGPHTTPRAGHPDPTLQTRTQAWVRRATASPVVAAPHPPTPSSPQSLPSRADAPGKTRQPPAQNTAKVPMPRLTPHHMTSTLPELQTRGPGAPCLHAEDRGHHAAMLHPATPVVTRGACGHPRQVPLCHSPAGPHLPAAPCPVPPAAAPPHSAPPACQAWPCPRAFAQMCPRSGRPPIPATHSPSPAPDTRLAPSRLHSSARVPLRVSVRRSPLHNRAHTRGTSPASFRLLPRAWRERGCVCTSYTSARAAPRFPRPSRPPHASRIRAMNMCVWETEQQAAVTKCWGPFLQPKPEARSPNSSHWPRPLGLNPCPPGWPGGTVGGPTNPRGQ